MGPDGDFAGFGGAHRPLGGDDVAVVQSLGDGEPGLAEGLFTQSHLDVAAVIAQNQKNQVAHHAVLHDTACHMQHRALVFGTVICFDGGIRIGVIGAARGGNVPQAVGALTQGSIWNSFSRRASLTWRALMSSPSVGSGLSDGWVFIFLLVSKKEARQNLAGSDAIEKRSPISWRCASGRGGDHARRRLLPTRSRR